MPSSSDLAFAEELIASFGADRPLVRLAELVSPAGRVESQLLRRIRLACVPDATAADEQELWFSELVAARTDDAIRFREDVTHALRVRLKARLASERATVLRARASMAEFHRPLGAAALLEDELAWAAVLEDRAEIERGARTLMDSLKRRREGLDHWLGRAWPTLPDELAETAAGAVLGQVAAARGAPVAPADAADGDDLAAVAHYLERVPLLLRRTAEELVLNAPAEEATHALEVPDTDPVTVELRLSERPVELGSRIEFDESKKQSRVTAPPKPREDEHRREVLRPGSPTRVDVRGREVELVTASGDVYAIPIATPSALSIEMLPAGNGTCLLLTYGDPSAPRRILVDGGPKATGRELAERFLDDELRIEIDLLVVTHQDANSVGGVIELLKRARRAASSKSAASLEIRAAWFNGADLPEGAAS